MNLASILNLTPAVPGVPAAPETANTPATSLVGEFSALLGLAVLPAAVEEPAIDAASTGKSLPDPHGNLLPEVAASDMLPGEPASLMALPSFLILTLPQQPMPRTPATYAELAGQLAQAVLQESLAAKEGIASAPPVSLATGVATPAPAPAASQASAAPPAPAPPAAPVPARGLHIQFDLLPPAIQLARTPQAEAPAPTAQQLAAMPVAQLHDPRREPGERTAAILAAVTAAAPKEGEPQAAAPVAPAAATAPPAVTTAVAAPGIASEAARSAQIDTPATSAPAARHDFEAVVERLSEARELARPGRATMQLAHREFGAVSVQFDMAGQSLKVGLASSDAAFAPAVQAALATQAERPIVAIGEAQGSRSDQQRSDQPLPAAQSSAAPASQGDGQARDQQARQAPGRHPSDQVQRQSQDGGERGDNAAASGRARDGSLFA